MSPALDELLCQRYPLILADRNRLAEDSCMGRGFECGDGWFDILDVLCERIQFLIDHQDDIPQVAATQIKEKFGTLRFRIKGGNAEIRGMIDMAESMSGRICELCGKPASIVQNSLKTRCQEHACLTALGIDSQEDCFVDGAARLPMPGLSESITQKMVCSMHALAP